MDGARLLYQAIPESHERRCAALTTNVEPGRWGTVFADDRLAAAIVSRVVRHGMLVEFDGPNHRLRRVARARKGAMGRPRGLVEALPDALDVEAIAVDKHDLTPKYPERPRGSGAQTRLSRGQRRRLRYPCG